jgi:hypothetical protein
MRTIHAAEINASLLSAYRALRVARMLRIHRDRPDWRACVAFQLNAASSSTRHAVALRAERDASERLEAALAEPLADWERALV